MKFKAAMMKQRRLLEITKLLEKLGKTCILHLKNNNTINIVQTPTLPEDAHIWITLRTSSIFSEFKMESKMDNEISFEVDILNLTRALKSAESGDTTTLKLTKKQDQPYLTFDIIKLSPQMRMIQDVPVIVFSASEMHRYSEPHYEDPLVRLIMPPLKNLSHVVDRCKSLSEFIVIRANMGGELELGVDTQMVRTATHYRNLDLPSFEWGKMLNICQAGQGPTRRDPGLKAEAKLGIALFSRVLAAHILKPKITFCGFGDNGPSKCIMWHMLLEDQTAITFYLPVYSSE